MVSAPKATAPQRGKHTAFVVEHVDVDYPMQWIYRRLWEHGGWPLVLAKAAVEIAQSQHVLGVRHLEAPAGVLLDKGWWQGGAVLVPMRWVGEDGFPVLDGNLELLPAGADACRVRLVAAWRQPCAAAGEARPAAFDEMAVCTARTFLDLLAARLYDGATGPRALRRRSNARRR